MFNKCNILLNFICLSLVIMFVSCSKDDDAILFETKWILNSELHNGIEVIKPCEKDDQSFFCYCGLLTVKKLGMKCEDGEPVKIEKTFVLAKDNKSMTISDNMITEKYLIKKIDVNSLILESTENSITIVRTYSAL